MIDFDQLTQMMGDLRENEVLSIIREVAESAPTQARKAMDALSGGMNIVGERFDNFEYFVGDLIFAGEIFSGAVELLKPVIPRTPDILTERKKVILATAEGDLHDIGKNIVKAVLESKGLEVVDMGVNVSPSAIVNRAIEEDAGVIALSAVLTTAVEAMQRTVEACVSAGIRDNVAIIVGGAGVNAAIAKRIKADHYGKTPEDTAAFCLSR